MLHINFMSTKFVVRNKRPERKTMKLVGRKSSHTISAKLQFICEAIKFGSNEEGERMRSKRAANEH